MTKANTVPAVLASQNSSKGNGTAKLATLLIKCNAAIDGRKLAYILRHEATDMESFISIYEATAAQYPFHQRELCKAFYTEVNR